MVDEVYARLGKKGAGDEEYSSCPFYTKLN